MSRSSKLHLVRFSLALSLLVVLPSRAALLDGTTYIVTPFVGNDGGTGEVDGVGTAAHFVNPIPRWTDGQYLYISDAETIRRVDLQTRQSTTLAGAPGNWCCAEGVGAGVQVGGNSLWGDSQYLYLLGGSPSPTVLRRMDLTTGEIKVVAGGDRGYADGYAPNILFDSPYHLRGDGTNLYLVDFLPTTGAPTIRQFTIATGEMQTVATLPPPPPTDEYHPFIVNGLWVRDDAFYIADSLIGLRRIDRRTSKVTTIGQYLSNFIIGLCSDDTNLYMLSRFNLILKMDFNTQAISSVAISSLTWSAADVTRRTTNIQFPNGIWSDRTYLYTADSNYGSIRRIDFANATVETFAGNPPSSYIGAVDGAGSAVSIAPQQLWLNGGYIYFTDAASVRKVEISTGIVTTIAGDPTGQSGAVDGVGPAARFNRPSGLWGDGNNLYVVNSGSHIIDKVVIQSGEVSTLAGHAFSSTPAASVDGIGTDAGFASPYGIWGDGLNLYVTDSQAIRKIVIATGEVTTLAGIFGMNGFADGIGTAASFQYPGALWSDGTLLYVMDSGRLRTIDVSTAQVTTIDGGPQQSTPVDGQGSAATFGYGTPQMWGDGTNLFFTSGSSIRRLHLPTRDLVTIAGSQNPPNAYGLQDGMANTAVFGSASGITSDGTILYVADSNAIRKLTPVTTNSTLTDYLPVSLNSGTALVTSTSGTPPSIQVGYARLDSTNTTAEGQAIFDYVENGTLVSETAVPAVTPLLNARLAAEVDGPLNTGVAIVNSNTAPATVSFYLTDPDGTTVDSGSLTIPPQCQIARFLTEAPFSGPAVLHGSLTLSSTAPISIMGIRGLTNERSEFLMSTVPVLDLDQSPTAAIIPHYADGGGWTTFVELTNPTSDAVSGSIQLLDDNGNVVTTSSYSIAPSSSFELSTAGQSSSVQSGAIQILPATGPQPGGNAILRFVHGGITVSEAAVPASSPAGTFDLFAAQSTNGLQTGVALANPAPSPINVRFELFDLTGISTGLTASASIPANGHLSRYVSELTGYGSLSSTFRGVLRASTDSSAGISVVGIRAQQNARSDYITSTIYPIADGNTASASPLVFPEIADGGGYSTQIMLFAAPPASAGTLRFLTANGKPLMLGLLSAP